MTTARSLRAQPGFVQLDRRFATLTEIDDFQRLARESYFYRSLESESGLSWNQLLEARIVVVLAEAGSGKTSEFNAQADNLLAKGIPAFHLRLDDLQLSFESALSAADASSVGAWQEGTEPAHFFLDSADEARMHGHAAFERALRNFAKGIGLHNAHRARICISARISEWRGQTDRELVERHLVAESTLSLGPLDFLIVRLLALDSARIQALCVGSGMDDPGGFLRELDKNDAWDIATRPADVIGLIDLWQAGGQLGSLTELMDHNCTLRLKERHNRSSADSLSPRMSLDGAMTLGAATVLCNSQSFSLPDGTDRLSDSDALVASSCLPAEWTATNLSDLLQRPLFDPASYDRVRFHHRSVAEYLASRWLSERMDLGCPYSRLECILFRMIDGEPMLRTRLAPVAAWMAQGSGNWRSRLRKRLLQSDPALFLSHGDPQSLSIEYRNDILSALFTRYAGARWAYLEAAPGSVMRIARGLHSSHLSELILKADAPIDVRRLGFQIVESGHIEECASVASHVFLDAANDSRVRAQALSALAAVGSDSQLASIWDWASSQSSLDGVLCGSLMRSLFPRIIGPPGVLMLLGKCDIDKNDAYHDVGDTLRQLLRDAPSTVQLAEFLAEIVQLIPPENTTHDSVSSFAHAPVADWVAESLLIVLDRLLTGDEILPQSIPHAAIALYYLHDAARNGGRYLHVPDGFQRRLSAHPQLRRAFVWRVVQGRISQDRQSRPSAFEVFTTSLVPFDPADMEWVLEDLASPDSRKAGFALDLAALMWEQGGRRWSTRQQIQRRLGTNRELLVAFRALTPIGPTRWWRSLRRRTHTLRLSWPLPRLRSLANNRLRTYLTRLRIELAVPKLRTGEAWDLLAFLGGITRARSAAVDLWRPEIDELRNLFGARIAKAATIGWSLGWQAHSPELPWERQRSYSTSIADIAGLYGATISCDAGLIFESLPNPVAETLSRYAFVPMVSFPPWLERLARERPEHLRRLLIEGIDADFRAPAGGEPVNTLLSRLSHGPSFLADLVADHVVEKLSTDSVLTAEVLRASFEFLFRFETPSIVGLAAVAQRRVSALTSLDDCFVTWLGLWIQLDAPPALDYLEQWLRNNASAADDFAERLLGALSSSNYRVIPLRRSPDYRTAKSLERLFRIAITHVAFAKDIVREGGVAYSPTLRDGAQRFRDSLLQVLSSIADSDVRDTLRKLATDPAFEGLRDYIQHLARVRSGEDANDAPWLAEDVRTFRMHFEHAPRSGQQLFELILDRLHKISEDVQSGPSSLRDSVPIDAHESVLRNFVRTHLTVLATDYYKISQEEEVDKKKRTDLRALCPGLPAITIELKWAQRRSLQSLEDDLRDQLVNRYLRNDDSRHGIYVLGCHSNGSGLWMRPNGPSLNLDELVLELQRVADLVRRENPMIEDLRVVKIDFRS